MGYFSLEVNAHGLNLFTSCASSQPLKLQQAKQGPAKMEPETQHAQDRQDPAWIWAQTSLCSSKTSLLSPPSAAALLLKAPLGFRGFPSPFDKHLQPL